MQAVQPITKSVSWTYSGQYIVTLRIKPGKNFLAAFVQETPTKKVYIQEVTNKFIKNSKTLNNFSSYTELYDYLSKPENYKDVIFASNALQFTYQKQVDFIDLVLYVRSNFPELQAGELQAALGEQKNALQKQIKDSERKQQAEIDGINAKIGVMQAEGKKFKDQTIAREEAIQADIAKINQKLSNAPNAPVLPAFYNNPGNTHMFFYTVAVTGPNSGKLVHQAVSELYYNFVNGVQILPKQKVRYTVKANIIASFAPMVGFCTSAGFGQLENYKQPESAYYSYSGKLYNGGAPTDIPHKAGVGDSIALELDYAVGKITWWKEKAEIASIKIPAQMTGKTIYLSILIWQQGDEMDMVSA